MTPCPLKEAHCPPVGWEQATPQKLKRLYRDQDNVTGFASLRAQLDAQQPPQHPSLVGTWDDHDFGLNDGDGRLK